MKVINNISKLYERRKDLRSHGTPQEALLWLQLRNSKLGYKFRRQHSIGGYIVDFYCPTKKLIIEIDGSQHFTKDAKEYDVRRTFSFEVLDLKVIRFTNAEINMKMDCVLQKIRAEF